MKKNHSVIKRLLSVLLITTMLISPAFLSPFKANAFEQVMDDFPSFWPGGTSIVSAGDHDTVNSSNYTDVSITASEYPNAKSFQLFAENNHGNGDAGSLLKIVQIPGSDGSDPEDYNLTLHLFRPQDGIDIVMPTLNYYLPVKQTLTSSDGRTCDIFIIAIPEIRNYSEKYNVSDYLDSGVLFREKYLEINELYWNMYDNYDFPAMPGGFHPMARRALMALAHGMNGFLIPKNAVSYGMGFPFDSSMKPEITAAWLQATGYFTPIQSEHIFNIVYSYYIEYVKTPIVPPDLIELSAYGSIGEEQEDGSFVLYYPAGIDMKRIQKTAVYKTKDSAPVEIDMTGGWKVNGISFVTLYAKDPATIHVYSNDAKGIIKDDVVVESSILIVKEQKYILMKMVKLTFLL